MCRPLMTDSHSSAPPANPDPRDAGPKPPYPRQAQPFPGGEARLQPPADHGEESYAGSGKLAGRVALITGADSGIGRAVAIAFAREGADVLVSYFNEKDDALETARWVEAAGRRAVTVPGDVRDERFAAHLVQRCLDDLGRLDLVVNNAGYQMSVPDITRLSTEEFDRTLRTNVYGPFFVCRAAVPHLPPGGVILNTASLAAYQPEARLVAYATSQGAVISFSKALALQLLPHGIRVNVVAPGPVWTPLVTTSLRDELVAAYGADTPMGRPAQPAEVAPIYVFLASPQASYITGAVYPVAGGLALP
jgi:NAD(P)-dependent dehydrogenase (short-subunit alcohol dehydrogenase family)